MIDLFNFHIKGSSLKIQYLKWFCCYDILKSALLLAELLFCLPISNAKVERLIFEKNIAGHPVKTPENEDNT
jgi:hypothetical protein